MSNAINYKSLEHQRASELQTELQRKLESKTAREGGPIDSLHKTILRHVVAGNYDSAQSEIVRFVKLKEEYPGFPNRVSPYVKHCKELIIAIRTKRELPGLGTLPMSKQQELYDRITEHFDELREYLKRIEIVEKEVKLEDLRSTVWVLKALFHSVFVIFVIGFAQEVIFGLSGSMNIVVDDIITNIVKTVFQVFG